MTKLSLGRLGAGVCFRDPTGTIRKLLARASDPRSDHFEAISARTIANRFIRENVKRGAVRIADVFEYDQTKPSRRVLLPLQHGVVFLDLLPGDLYDPRPRRMS